jgi:transposase
MSLRTLHRRVGEVAAWRRPRLVAKGDPDREQVLAGLHQKLSELPDGAVVLAEDETHINLLPWVRATWVAHGARQQVMTPGTNRRRTIFGAVDLASGRFCYQVARKEISATFIAFLEHLQQAYPAAPVVAVVCDNVIIHRSKLVQRWLADHPGVRVLHGARYSPHDNPTERIWAALKAWLANSPTLTIHPRGPHPPRARPLRVVRQLLPAAAGRRPAPVGHHPVGRGGRARLLPVVHLGAQVPSAAAALRAMPRAGRSRPSGARAPAGAGDAVGLARAARPAPGWGGAPPRTCWSARCRRRAAGVACCWRPRTWHLVDGLDRVARRLGGLTRRWRFDRMATFCQPVHRSNTICHHDGRCCPARRRQVNLLW